MKPNLIYIFADQLRYSSVGYAGDKKARTPKIDALCEKSVNCVNAVSGHPVCAPYRASLLTGKYTTSTGMVINEIRMNPNHKSFAHVLNDAGYEAEYIGKWHLYAAELGNHLDAKNSYIPKGVDRLGFDGYFAAFNFHHDYYGDSAYYHLDSPEKIFHEKYEPDSQTDMAIERLEKLSDSEKPFALFLSLGTPHDPWIPENVPAEYLDMFKDEKFELPSNYLPNNDVHADAWARLNEKERAELTEWMRVYYAMTANLDYNIGRLTDCMEKLNLFENSIVIFTSDHGELFGAHGRRAKNIFYDEAVRVPFLLRFDPKTQAGSVCDVCLNTVDIMPTLLNMMELSVPEEVEGTDYSKCITNAETSPEEGSLMMCTGPTAVFNDGNEWRAYRTKRYTYAIFKSDESEFLFDNINDEYQMENLAEKSEYAPLKKELSEKMHAKMEIIGDTFEKNSYYKENWIKDRIILKTATLNNLRG